MKTLKLFSAKPETIPASTAWYIADLAIQSFSGDFTLADLERACPGVSHDMARKVLHNLRRVGDVECQGRGPGARWKSLKKKG